MTAVSKLYGHATMKHKNMGGAKSMTEVRVSMTRQFKNVVKLIVLTVIDKLSSFFFNSDLPHFHT